MGQCESPEEDETGKVEGDAPLDETSSFSPVCRQPCDPADESVNEFVPPPGFRERLFHRLKEVVRSDKLPRQRVDDPVPDEIVGGGRFESPRVLGRGGLGTVYLCHDVLFSRLVALKVCGYRPQDSQDHVVRFRREYQLLARLQHPTITPVYQTGSLPDGRPFYVMKYIDGLSLLEAVNQLDKQVWTALSRSKAFRQLLEVFLDVCSAVEHAHALGIIHRDLKPLNIMVDLSKRGYVVDWGLAKQLTGSEEELQLQPVSDAVDPRLTTHGAIIGTLSWMSPEQATGGTHTPATDIYGLGATLYHILTGQPPHQLQANEDQKAACFRISSAMPPRADATCPGVSSELASICERSMQLDPQSRYPSVSCLKDDLQRWLRHEFVEAHEYRYTIFQRLEKFGSRHQRTILVTFGVLLFSLLGVGWGAWQISQAAAETEKLAGELATSLTEAELLAKEKTDLATKEHEARQAETLQRQQAEVLAGKLQTALTATEQQLYFSQIYRAQAALNSGQPALARAALQSVPLRQRHWEHGYLCRQAEGTPLTIRYSQFKRVAFSPDGQRIIGTSGGANRGLLKVWDVATGGELSTFRGHDGEVFHHAFSPDGERIVSASKDMTLKVWNVETGAEVLTLSGHSGRVTSVAFSPDGQRIVSGEIKRIARDDSQRGVVSTVDVIVDVTVWDATTGAVLLTLPGLQKAVSPRLSTQYSVRSVAFSPDSQRIISVSGDFVHRSVDVLKIWDVATGAELLTLSGHDGWVNSVAFSPDGLRIVGGGDSLKMWDATTGAELLAIGGQQRTVYSVAFSPDGQRIVSGGVDRTLKLWNAITGAELFTLHGHEEPVTSVAYSPDGQRILSCSNDNTIKVWDASGAEQLAFYEEPRVSRNRICAITCLAFSPDGQRIVSGRSASVSHRDGEDFLKVRDIETGAELLTLGKHRIGVASVAFSPDGQRIVSCGMDDTLKVWNAETGAELLALSGLKVASVAFSPDGERILCGGNAGLTVRDAATGAELLTLSGHDGWRFKCGAFSPDGQRIVCRDDSGTVRVWGAATGEELLTIGRRGPFGINSVVAFSPDGQRIAGGGESLKVWNSTTGAEMLTLGGPNARFNSVEFSPDGQRIVCGGNDGIRVWDAITGAELLTLRGTLVNSVVFSPDGRRIVSGDSFGMLNVWDSTSGTEFQSLGNLDLSVLGISEDGRWIVARNASRQIVLWESATGQRVDDPPSNVLATLRIRPVSPDGLLQVLKVGPDSLLVRKNPHHNPWRIAAQRLTLWGPLRSAESAQAALAAESWFAARFHLRALLAHGDAVLAKHGLKQRSFWEAALEQAEIKLTTNTPEPAR